MFVVAFKNVDRVTIFECRASLGIVRWDAVNISQHRLEHGQSLTYHTNKTLAELSTSERKLSG